MKTVVSVLVGIPEVAKRCVRRRRTHQVFRETNAAAEDAEEAEGPGPPSAHLLPGEDGTRAGDGRETRIIMARVSLPAVATANNLEGEIEQSQRDITPQEETFPTGRLFLKGR